MANVSQNTSEFLVQVAAGLVIPCIIALVSQYLGLVRLARKTDRKVDSIIDYLRDRDPDFGVMRHKRRSRMPRQEGTRDE